MIRCDWCKQNDRHARHMATLIAEELDDGELVEIDLCAVCEKLFHEKLVALVQEVKGF